MMWATVTQLQGLPGLPASAPRCRELLERIGAQRRERAARGGGYEYLATDLPAEAQQALAARAASRLAGAIQPTADAVRAGREAKRSAQVQACATAMARYGVQLESSGGFDPATNPRLDLFQRFERYHAQRGTAVWPCIQEFCLLWQAGQIEALPGTRTAYPALPGKTLDKWYRAWRVKGVEALLERKPRKDKGQTALSRDQVMHDAFVGALAGMHEPTARQVQRVLANELAAHGRQAPPTGTIKRWMRDYQATNKVALLKLKNPDGWRNKYMPAFGSRSEHVLAVNQEWQLDSTIADAQQRVEIAFNLHDADTGEIRRHALVAGIDVRSRRAQVLVSRTSSSNAVKAVVRRAMLDWGMPQLIKTDNGKDYTAQDFKFALDALKVEHKLCTPFSPDQKPFIERFLGTLLHDLFPMLHGFVGHDVATRKAIESSLSFAQRFGHGGLRLRMTPEQLQGVINGWLAEYHARVHSELGCSPNDMAAQHTTHTVRVDERALDLFLMPVAGNGIRTVGKRGISMPLNGAVGTAWYAAPELARVDVMGQQVYCRIDDADVGAMHVFALSGAYICRALDHTRLGINRGELAAKTRVMESESVKPLMDALRRARRSGLAQKAANAIYAERQDAAIAAASNVARLAPRVVTHTTPAVASVLAAHSTTAQDNARAQARAALGDEGAAPVVQPLSQKQLYSVWVRLQARMRAGEQISQAELDRARSYEQSSAFKAWHAMQDGADPLPLSAAGGA